MFLRGLRRHRTAVVVVHPVYLLSITSREQKILGAAHRGTRRAAWHPRCRSVDVLSPNSLSEATTQEGHHRKRSQRTPTFDRREKSQDRLKQSSRFAAGEHLNAQVELKQSQLVSSSPRRELRISTRQQLPPTALRPATIASLAQQH